MKKVVKIAPWVLLLGGMILLLSFVNNQQSETVCWNFEIDVDHSNGFYFLNANDVKKTVYALGDSIVGSKMKDIDIRRIESAIIAHPAVRLSEVCTTIDGQLTIHVEQRSPIVRVLNKDGSSFYIDHEARPMPAQHGITAHVLVVSGNIDLPDPHEASNSEDPVYQDIYGLAKHIQNDPFLRAQIDHVYVDEQQEFTLVPRVGNHEILLGSTHRLDQKTKKLKVFYKNTIKHKDLNKYKSIDLRFRDQVVCAKKP